MPETLRDVKGERDSLKQENAQLRAEVHDLKEKFAQQTVTLHELMAKTGMKLKEPYVYRNDECRPVSLGNVCEKCGFDYRPGSPTLYHRIGREKEGRAAHPVA